MTTALIDADIVAYRCAATVENDGPEIGCLRADILMRDILTQTMADSYKAFLSGEDNFRYQLFPLYKANRKDKPKPKYLPQIQEFLLKEWKAEFSVGCEADDLLGINQTEETVICSIDKDLLQIPGNHYNFVKKELKWISLHEGLSNFYKQLIIGDVSDNIPGFDGKARLKPPKFLGPELENIDQCRTEQEMFESVQRLYNSVPEEQRGNLELNAQLLYIWRKENDRWEAPKIQVNT